MNFSEEISYQLAWSATDWLTYNRFKKIIQLYGNLKTAWENIHAGDLEFIGENKTSIDNFIQQKKQINPQREFDKINQLKLNFSCITDNNYPLILKQIASPPVFLYYKGQWRDNDNIALSIVGTRNITHYGKQITKEFTSKLAKKLVIISGLALGVDTVAHETCLEVGGRTIAVLGSGLDVLYPSKNKYLADKILANNGMIISEFPLKTLPNNYNFPRRNRIISGLSLGTLVIEGKIESGSLITARTALEQNKEVFAIPGNIYSPQSAGTNLLIKKGEAKLVNNVEDILEELSIETKQKFVQVQTIFSFASPEEELIYEALNHEGQNIDDIAVNTNLLTYKISANLSLMELKGLAQNIGGGLWIKNNF